MSLSSPRPRSRPSRLRTFATFLLAAASLHFLPSALPPAPSCSSALQNPSAARSTCQSLPDDFAAPSHASRASFPAQSSADASSFSPLAPPPAPPAPPSPKPLRPSPATPLPANLAPLPAGLTFPLPYAIALDELYLQLPPSASSALPVPGAPRSRILSIPAQPDLPALLAYAATLATSHTAPAPRLILYPPGTPRTSAHRRIVTPTLDLPLSSATAPLPAARPDLGILAWERPRYAPSRALARIQGDPAAVLRAAAALAASGLHSARPLLARQHTRRLVPNDPLFRDQWHLRNTGQQSGRSGIDIRAVPAWDTASGTGIVIGIVDDGLDRLHPDLSPAYSAPLSYDFNDTDTDPRPVADGPEGDHHGTAVAGLAAARGDNFIGLAGSAPFATLAGLRLIGAPTTDEQDALAMAWRNDAIHIKNNSWGPDDASATLSPPGPLWRAAIAEAVTTGRSGRGTLFPWSAGNGQSDFDQGPKDGYASLRYVLAVAAVTNLGLPASFSEGGPHLLVAAPGAARLGLATTDRSGDAGYNATTESAAPGDYVSEIDYTRTFTGTSAAAPVAAGALALLLEARPDLGWRDVKEILLRSSTKLIPSSTDWTTRPAGDPAHPIKHHPRLGGGLLNALDALALARTWRTLDPETTLTATPALSLPAPIPDSGRGLLTTTFTLPPGAPLLRVEHVELTLDIAHSYRGDLSITLTSPAGTVSTFATPTPRDSGEDYTDFDANDGYTFSSVRHWGETSALPSTPSALWRLTIRDASAGDTGTLRSARLALHGPPLVAPTLATPAPDQTLATGSTLLLAPTFAGGNLTYQWTHNGRPVPGANSSTLTLPAITAKTAGTYTCTATNPLGTATSPTLVTLDDTPRADFHTRVGSTTEIDLRAAYPDDYTLLRTTALPPGLTLDLANHRLLGRPTRTGSTRVVLTLARPDTTLVNIPVTVTTETLAPALTSAYLALLDVHPQVGAPAGGLLRLTTTATGRATGTLTLGRTAHPFSTLLDGQLEGPATLDVALPRASLRLTATLALDGTLTAQVNTTDLARPFGSAPLTGRLSPWHKTTRPATALAFPYAVALAPRPATTPLGATLLTFTVNTAGLATWRLSPADGSPDLTGTTPLDDEGTLHLHAPYAANLGSLLGRIRIDSGSSAPIDADDQNTASLTWNRPPSPTLALPAGITELPLAIATGSGIHTPPATGQLILDRTPSTPALEATDAPSAADQPTTDPLAATISLAARNRIAAAAPNPLKLALAYAPATGRITGSYQVRTADPSAPTRIITRTVRIKALVLPDQREALGHSFTPGHPAFPAPRSGLFSLTPPATP